MRHEFLGREIRRDRQLECTLGLAVRSTEMSFDPYVIIMDQVTVELCHRTFWYAAEEYYQSSFEDHMDTLCLRCIGRCSGDDLVSASAIGQ